MRKAFIRVFKTGWTSFKRNSYLSLGTTGVMTLVLLLFSGLMVVNFLSNEIVRGIENQIDVSAYFKEEAPEEEILQMKTDLEKLPDVQSVAYISRTQALEDFKSKNAGKAIIEQSLAELDFNPLQASLVVKAKDPQNYVSIVQYLEGNKYRTLIDKITYYENEIVIKKVQNISNGIRNWGLVATMVLAVIAILVTFNTIRLTIYNQKQEIEIMRLVGGSYWHVKAPYLIEGGLYGLFASLVTIVIFYPSLYAISSKFGVLMPGINILAYFGSNALQYISIILLAGILLGVLSSFVAIRRFLRV
ncbi:MAG TPA: permease-like cell division protein FtsX [Candidatus Paceibacterota bacterium]